MPDMPPKNQELGEADNLLKIGEGLRAASIAGSDFVANAAVALTVRLAKGLRSEGLDGGGRLSRYLHGGDAHRTAVYICEPLHALAADLYNAGVNATIFKRRVQTAYIDAIRAARQPHGAESDIVVVK